MTAEQSFERAVERLPEIITAARVFGADKAFALFARELLLAQAEAYDEAAQFSDYCGNDHMHEQEEFERKAAELRRAAEGV